MTVNSLGTKIAKEATQTIPIVMIGITDPVGQGLVQSLASPGGNVTGTTDDTGAENAQKRLHLLKEMLPAITTVACLVAPSPFRQSEGRILESAAAALDIKALFADHSPGDYSEAFALIARERPDALSVSQLGENFPYRQQIVEFAAANRLPAIYAFSEFVRAGGLMSYGMDVADLFRRAAGYVDSILKGTKPSELPVEQPTKFELAVNLKTAKALGLTVPTSLLLRADEIIE